MTHKKKKWFIFRPTGEKNKISIKAETYEKAKQRYNKLVPKRYRI